MSTVHGLILGVSHNETFIFLFLFCCCYSLSLWTTLLLVHLFWGNSPLLWWLLPPLLKLCPIKYQLVLSIVSWLISMPETDISVNTSYICHNYVHYLSLQVYHWSLS